MVAPVSSHLPSPGDGGEGETSVRGRVRLLPLWGLVSPRDLRRFFPIGFQPTSANRSIVQRPGGATTATKPAEVLHQASNLFRFEDCAPGWHHLTLVQNEAAGVDR